MMLGLVLVNGEKWKVQICFSPFTRVSLVLQDWQVYPDFLERMALQAKR